MTVKGGLTVAKYTIGVDFGTLSGRALLVDAENGRELADAVMEYPHGVMDREFCATGETLPANFALQHPADYLQVLENVIPAVLEKAGVNAADVVGLGIDFTSCTLLSVDSAGTPLCLLPEFEQTPLAYAILWKHHAAKKYADRLTKVARARNEAFLARCGGKVDDEWTFAKMYQVMAEAPAVYAAADRFLEGGDWLVQTLTGTRVRSYHFAAYKSHFVAGTGYPKKEYFDAVDPKFGDTVLQKLDGELLLYGERAGALCAEYAKKLGLCAGTAVAVAMPDGHAAGTAVGLSRAGDMFAVLGTSGCFMAVGDRDAKVPGICGTVKDGIVPGFYGYEAGLCSLGDHFAFAAANLTSPAYAREAAARGIGMLPLLLEKAAAKKPGESGLLALNWFNGNRSILVNSDLSGCFVGLTQATAPEDMLRALLEATAFGARNIIENFEQNGVSIGRIIATGGIARKDPFTMQLYADVLGRPITVTKTAQAPALGAAIGAAVAAGVHATPTEGIERMHADADRIYTPNGASFAVYSDLYAEYKRLHDYFGRGDNNVMARLRALAAAQKGN
ncbi:MAG: ribulokinase [Ruminococcaceae bacterium]|nr:ribulokinase [Oscillospiraceae bacterium]